MCHRGRQHEASPNSFQLLKRKNKQFGPYHNSITHEIVEPISTKPHTDKYETKGKQAKAQLAIAEEDALDHVLEQRGRAEDAPEPRLPRRRVHRLELRHRRPVLLRQPQHPPHLFLRAKPGIRPASACRFGDDQTLTEARSVETAYEDAVLVERGESTRALYGDEERGARARWVGGDAGEEGHGAVGGEAERAHERAGGGVPPVGRHHEQAVAAHGRRQVERRRAAGREQELQLHARPSVQLRARGGVAAGWVWERHGCVSRCSSGRRQRGFRSDRVSDRATGVPVPLH